MGGRRGGLKPLMAASSSSPWQEGLLPCCWAGPAQDRGWDWLPSKRVGKGDEQLAGTYKSRSRKKERIYCVMANVRLCEEKLFCSQHCCGPQTHWWDDALSITPASPPPSPDSPSLQRSDWCGWAQRVTQHLPRAVESSLLPFISDLVAAGNKKPVWWLDFEKDSVLLGTEQKSATNITEGDAENREYLNLAQGCCYPWLRAAWRGRMVEGMVEGRLGP